MAKRNRHLRISLAAKCQILFGAAVILIIGAALYVPWKRMDGLINEVNLQTAEGLANQAKLEHIARERPKNQSPTGYPTTRQIIEQEFPAESSGFVWPRMIPVNPPRTMPLGRFDIDALQYFLQHPTDQHYPKP